MTADLASGSVHVSATRIGSEPGWLGTVVLVHDLSYLDRREAAARNFLLIAFFVLSLGAAIVTLLAARFAWRGWTMELRQALAGHPTRDFRPLVRDVRTLVERLAGQIDPHFQLRHGLAQLLNLRPLPFFGQPRRLRLRGAQRLPTVQLLVSVPLGDQIRQPRLLLEQRAQDLVVFRLRLVLQVATELRRQPQLGRPRVQLGLRDAQLVLGPGQRLLIRVALDGQEHLPR